MGTAWFLLFLLQTRRLERKMEQIQNSPTRSHMHIHAQTDTCFEHTQIHPGRHIWVSALTQIFAYKCLWTLRKSQTLMEKTRRSSSPSAPGQCEILPCSPFANILSSLVLIMPSRVAVLLSLGALFYLIIHFTVRIFFHSMLPEFPFS